MTYSPTVEPTDLACGTEPYLDRAETAIELSWRFNPGVGDGRQCCAQVRFQIFDGQARPVSMPMQVETNYGTTFSITPDIVSREDGSQLSSWDGCEFLKWQVRCAEGQNGETWSTGDEVPAEAWSVWSQLQAEQFADRPVIAFARPTEGELVAYASTAIALNVPASCENVGLKLWEVTSQSGGETTLAIPAGVEIARHTPRAWSLRYLQNNKTYRIEATATSNTLDAVPATVDFTTSFAKPYRPTISLSADYVNGQVHVSVATDRSSGTTAPDNFVVERSYTGVDGWVRLGNLRPGQTVHDIYAAPNAWNFYQAWGVKSVAVPGAATEIIVSDFVTANLFFDDAQGRVAWLTSADGAINLKVLWDPEFSATRAQASAEAHFFAGRDIPVMIAGKAYQRVINLAWSMMPEDYQDGNKGYLQMARLAGHYHRPLLYRGPHMEPFWGMPSSYSEEWNRGTGEWRFNLTLTEVAPDA